ncbi:multidrug DMT transporter permease [Acidobacteriia bacterium AH_259_A11_L15]|nr:multidrug DMT transporter permease [Acidobacteriia bacterium AH_259_A11_L15]
MFVLHSYVWAVAFCGITMLCWGSWANTQKLTRREWRFELFYWDYAVGVLLVSLVFALTLGSLGSEGRSFLQDIGQAETPSLLSAFIGGVIFNAANILLVAAIDIAGMAVAFPVGIGLALVLGVVVNYIGLPEGNPLLLFGGVAFVVLAILLDATAYRRLPGQAAGVSRKGLGLSLACGVLMGFFYRFVAASMSADFTNPEAGKMGPYAAVVVFSLGLLASNFLFNAFIMKKPFVGEPLSATDYFRGDLRTHSIGVLGGTIWGVGMTFSIIASGQAGFAISYGLGQGATMVAALWGVFVWREFKAAPPGTGKLLALMFVCFLAGLVLIIAARTV